MKSYKSGMTLLEVIASMFIICIGLLSVLMVIPYGAVQVSKVRNAEYISSMLAAGVEDLKITEWDKNIKDSTGKKITESTNAAADANVYIIDPFVAHSVSSPFVQCFLGKEADAATAGIPYYLDVLNLDQMMTNKNDLDYLLKEDARTEIQSTSHLRQYTYFITIKPKQPVAAGAVIPFTTDILGCYQRVDEFFKLILSLPPQYYLQSAKFTVDSSVRCLDFSTTKYVFVTWIDGTDKYYEWCKIVSVLENNNGKQEIVVLMSNASGMNSASNIHIFVFPGVLYHKQM
jgi:prepilin-type N-terminal cleavage/methylation domain-containing protein